MTEYRLYARDVNYQRLGEIDDYAGLKAELRVNDVGGFFLTAPASSRAAALLTKTGGITITRNTLDGSGPVVVFSGRVTSYSIDAQSLEVTGSSDELVLAEKAASPDPSTVGPPAGPAYATDQDLRNGTASTVMLAYVRDNAVSGFAATSASGRNRAVPGLTLGTDLGIGATVYGQARWISLLALMQDLALDGGRDLSVGSLRFQVLQSSIAASTITFTVSVPTDRRASVIISRERGTLGAWKRTVNRPAATVVYSLGQGDGANRLVIAGVDAAASTEYGYEIEAIDDRRDVSDALALLQANANALINSGEDAVVTFTPIDTPSLAWGVDYDLGDLVTVVTQNAATGESETLAEIVRGVDLTLTAPGSGSSVVEVQPIISTPGDTADDPAARQQRAVARRVGNLERNVDSLSSILSVQWNVGDLRMTTRAAAAAGWKLCNGQAISRVTYSGLFGVIGTTYGAGDGTTTFNVPDLRNRFPLGTSGAAPIGSTGGAVSADISHAHDAGTYLGPSHAHDAGTYLGPSHTHTGPSHTHTGPSHTHAAGTLAGPSHTHTGPSHTHAPGTLTVPNHSHAAGTLAGPSHTHTAGTLAGPSHTHAVGTLAGPSHTHSGAALGISGTTSGPTGTNTTGGTGNTSADGSHTHTQGTLDVTGATDASGTGGITGSMAADGTQAITGSSATGGTGSVTGSTATDGTTTVTGTSAADGTAATGSSGTGDVTGSSAADGTAATGASGTGATGASGTGSVTGTSATSGTQAVTGVSGTGGSGLLFIVPPYMALTYEIYAAA